MKKIILIVISIFILLVIISPKKDKTSDKRVKSSVSAPTVTIQPTIAVTDKEREIFYKYFEYEWSLPIVPIGDKSRHNKAISLTAKEFNISIDEAEKVYEKVTKAKPSEKEIEIYETLESGLEEALDNDSPSSPFNEKAVNNKVAKQYGISTIKLMAIYTLVLSDNEYQEKRKGKVAQELQKDKQNDLIEKRKKILQDFIEKINSVGMNEYLELVSYKYTDISECSVVIKVRNTWHSELKQIRLQAAQNLWNLWSQGYYLEDEKDKCRMELVDLNGNNVGGSSWMGGSVVGVKD